MYCDVASLTRHVVVAVVVVVVVVDVWSTVGPLSLQSRTALLYKASCDKA